jgi:hypothetical protein
MFLLSLFFSRGGVWVVDRWEGLYKMGWSAWNCREDENIFLYPCRKKIYIHRMFPKGWTNSECSYIGIYLISHPQDWRGAGLLNIRLSHSTCTDLILACNFFLCFFIP